MRKSLTIALFLAGMSLLQGCIGVAVVGAGAAASGMVINDRRSLQTISDDQQIEFTASNQVKSNPQLAANSHVVIASFDHIALLIGEVPNEEVREQVESLVASLPKVSRVYNQLRIAPPATPMQISKDTWITTKVKTEMLAARGLNSGQIKVETENGNVYLMGIVTHQQADIAVDVARQVSGVQRVVKLFEYSNL